MFYSKHPLPWQTAIELVAERTDMPLIILEARVSRSGYCKVNTILQPLLLAYRQPPFSVCSYDIFFVHVRGQTANKLSGVFSYKDTDPILSPTLKTHLNYSSKAPSPNAILVGVRASISGSYESTNIPSKIRMNYSELTMLLKKYFNKNNETRTSLMVQWLRMCLLIQGTLV